MDGGPVEKTGQDELAADRVALVRTQTQTSGVAADGTRWPSDGINNNLVNCAFILLKEQGPVLWKCFIPLGLATIIGGRITTAFAIPLLTFLGATYPAQAILFSRVVAAFSLSPDRGVAQGDFYSL